MLDATDLKAKADAVVTAGNAFVAAKINPSTTLAGAISAAVASRTASEALSAAVQAFTDQQYSDQIFGLEG